MTTSRVTLGHFLVAAQLVIALILALALAACSLLAPQRQDTAQGQAAAPAAASTAAPASLSPTPTPSGPASPGGLAAPSPNDPLPSWPASRPPKPPPPPADTRQSATGKISVGPAVTVASTEVPQTGGQIEYNRPGDPLNGLKVTVPANAYPDKRTFKVSYAPVTGATFKDFRAASPLVTVDNGGGYSSEMMNLTVPVKLAPDEFAMGFLYDDKTGKLEGLPLLAMGASSVTVGTYHYSNVIVGVIESKLLKKDIDSGFRPGIDDWQFVNRGSFIAPGGHCAGQSLTALWYYVNQPDGKDRTLYDRYDNNGLAPATPGIWEDDSYGYRFASVIQEDVAWDGFANALFRNLAGVDDELTLKAFIYAVQVTGEPQYVGIRSSQGGGHAMIAYRIKDNQLYIADPNYPGNNDRRIELVNGKFKPYNSGANAKEIAAGKGKPYETIRYVAKTAIVDWSLIARRWAEVKSGTIGNDRFPQYRLAYLDQDGKVQPLNDGTVITINPVTIGTREADMGIDIYRDGRKLTPDAKQRFPLVPGENKLGFAVYGKVKGAWEYVDFKYVTVRYQPGPVAINPDSITLSPRGSRTFMATVDGKLPAAGVLLWSVDEGAAGGDVTNFGRYTAPSQTGTYHVTATLAADKTKKATATITVSQVVLNLKPVTVTLAAGGKQAFVAEVTGNPETRVTWRVEERDGGTVTPDGVYTAPSQQGTYHVVATSRADASHTARATVSVIVPTPTPLRFTLALFPNEVVLLPGAKQEFRASLLGLSDTRVTWSGVPGPYIPPQSADKPVTFVASDVGDYTVTVTSVADPTKRAEAKVKVVPGAWVLTGKTEIKRPPNVGMGVPQPTGSVSLSGGSATATNQTGPQLSKWSFAWTEPPLSLSAGQRFKGTLSARDAGSKYDPKERQFPSGSVIIRVMSGTNIITDGYVSAGAGRSLHGDKAFTPSASQGFDLPIPKGRADGPSLIISADAVATAHFGEGTSWTQIRGEVFYKYELRPLFDPAAAPTPPPTPTPPPKPQVSVEFTYPVGQSPKVFTEGWTLGAKATLAMPDGTRKDVSDSVVWSGDATFSPSRGSQTKPTFNRASRLDDGPRQVTISVEAEGVKASATQTFQTVNPRKGYARLGDKVFAPAIGGGSPGAPFAVTGFIASGSPTVTIGGFPAARVGDLGAHCCSDGPNNFVITSGDSQVLIDGKPAARKQDKSAHDCTGRPDAVNCGGTGAGSIVEVASETLP